jgi:hypothetical protein
MVENVPAMDGRRGTHSFRVKRIGPNLPAGQTALSNWTSSPVQSDRTDTPNLERQGCPTKRGIETRLPFSSPFFLPSLSFSFQFSFGGRMDILPRWPFPRKSYWLSFRRTYSFESVLHCGRRLIVSGSRQHKTGTLPRLASHHQSARSTRSWNRTAAAQRLAAAVSALFGQFTAAIAPVRSRWHL